jgi:acetyl esterase/lipase
MSTLLNRRQMLGVCAAGASTLCLPSLTRAQQAKTKMKTFTFKKVGNLEFKADVHRADDNQTRPVMVWFHGGALIVGHRGGVSGRVLKDMLNAGYTVVSFDYRLAHETKLPEIMGDGAIADSRESQKNRGEFYKYCRQHGTWPQAISGWDHHRNPEKFYPYMTLKNVTKDYPPTLMVHGTEDTDVPYEQSTMMAKKLKQHGVEHQLVTIPGGEHGLVGGDPKLIEAAYQQAFQFMHERMS